MFKLNKIKYEVLTIKEALELTW